MPPASIKGATRRKILTRNILGYSSAATLGFIAGDLPGAYIGYKAYDHYYQTKYLKTMPPHRTPKRKRAHGRYAHPYSTPKTLSAPRKKHKRSNSAVSQGSVRRASVASVASRAISHMHEPKFNDVHSGIGTSAVHINLHKSVKHHSVGVVTYVRNRQYIIDCAAGQQKPQMVASFNTVTQWTQDVAYPVGQNAVRNNLFSLNPGQTNVGSNYFNAAVVQPLNDRFINTSVEWTAMFTNVTSTPTRVDLYFFVAKKNGPSTQYPDGLLGVGMQTDALGRVASTMQASGVPAAPTVGYGSAFEWPIKPTDVPLLRSFFKLLKVKSLLLAGGAVEEVKCHIKVNKLFKRDVIQQMSSSNDFIPGTTVCVMAVVSGFPGIDVTAGNPANTVASTLGRVAVVDSTKWRLSCVKDSGPGRFNSEQVDYNNLFVGAGIANLRQINAVDVAAAEQFT